MPACCDWGPFHGSRQASRRQSGTHGGRTCGSAPAPESRRHLLTIPQHLPLSLCPTRRKRGMGQKNMLKSCAVRAKSPPAKILSTEGSMAAKNLLVIFFFLIAPTSVTWAWQQGTVPRQPAGPPRGPEAGPPGQSYVGIPPSGPVSVPPAYDQTYGPRDVQSSDAQPTYPHYPYGAHHNPYYDGSAPGNFLSNTIDWVLSIPANIMTRVSDLVDGAFFPPVPATSGQDYAQDPGPMQDVAPQAPLPPASPYAPPSR